MLVNKSASKKERKTARRRLPPHRILKLLPYQKTTKLPGHNKSPNSAFPAPGLYYYSKNHSSSYNCRNRKNEIEKLNRKFIFSQCQLLNPALSPPNNFSSEKPATTFEHKKNPQPNSLPKHARSPTLVGILQCAFYCVRSERGLAPETGVASLEGDLVTLPEYLSIKEGFFKI